MQKGTKKPPLFAAGMLPAATVTTALLSPPSFGAAGDLDPAFGDIGRLGPILDGPAWSVQPEQDGTILLGGGSSGFTYYGWYGTTNFVTRLSGTGAIDPSFVAARPLNSQIIGIVRQPDGQVVAVGRQMNFSETNTQLVVHRLHPDGVLDATFADNGSFLLSATDYGSRSGATSVVLDPDGRIVVAGSQGAFLLVLRLLPDGSLDSSFGTAGVFEGPNNLDQSDGRSGARTNLLRTSSGGYRVTTTTTDGCQVIALSANGRVDASFGVAGSATVMTPEGPTAYCNSMDAWPDGRLLLGGAAAGGGFAARLSVDGQQDQGFSGDAVATAMARVTAVAADTEAAAVVAGVGDEGTSIMRLDAGGAPDLSFGDAGTTIIDLETDGYLNPVVNDLFVGANGRIVAAGGICVPWACYWGDQAFVVQLMGHDSPSPGVLGFRDQFDVQTQEGDGEVVINVRRTGGRTGSVSLTWETAPFDFDSAIPGEDYDTASGNLVWGDGEAGQQEIRVPVHADDAVEEQERFRVLLSEPQGGAGLGKREATIAIAPDGAPYGQFGFPFDVVDVAEHRPAQVTVSRDYYSQGAVSVTLTPVSGSATAGEDFVAEPVTLTWDDGEYGWKDALIPIVNDDRKEDLETFTIELSDPTNGALIGARSTTTVRIAANDRPINLSTDRSGGGTFGFISLLALGLFHYLRRGCFRTWPGGRWSGRMLVK